MRSFSQVTDAKTVGGRVLWKLRPRETTTRKTVVKGTQEDYVASTRRLGALWNNHLGG